MDSKCISKRELTGHAGRHTMKGVGHISKERGKGDISHLEDVNLEMVVKSRG